jgi:hypothetical protein
MYGGRHFDLPVAAVAAAQQQPDPQGLSDPVRRAMCFIDLCAVLSSLSFHVCVWFRYDASAEQHGGLFASHPSATVMGSSWFGVFDPPPSFPWTGDESELRGAALELTVESTPRRSKRRKLLTAATNLLLGPVAAPRSLPVTPITPAAMTSAAALAFWTPLPGAQATLDDDTGSSSPSRGPDSDLGSGSQTSNDSRESNSRSSFVQGIASQSALFQAPPTPGDDFSMPQLTMVPFVQASLLEVSPSALSASSASSAVSHSISLSDCPTLTESTVTCSAPGTLFAYDPNSLSVSSAGLQDAALARNHAASVWVRSRFTNVASCVFAFILCSFNVMDDPRSLLCHCAACLDRIHQDWTRVRKRCLISLWPSAVMITRAHPTPSILPAIWLHRPPLSHLLSRSGSPTLGKRPHLQSHLRGAPCELGVK